MVVIRRTEPLSSTPSPYLNNEKIDIFDHFNPSISPITLSRKVSLDTLKAKKEICYNEEQLLVIPLSRNASFRHTQSSSLIEAVNGLFDFLSPFPDLPMTSSTPSSTSPDSAQPQCRHRAWRILGVVGLCLYFLICTILLAGRWFFTTQIDNYRNEITQLSSDYLGVQVEAEKITGGFSKF